MKIKSIATAAALSVFLGFAPEACAGPEQGNYNCRLIRTALGANILVRQWFCLIIASNPTIPLAAYSTLVTSTSNRGKSESLSYRLEVQDDGTVKTQVKCKTQLEGGAYKFEVSGVGIGSFTNTSFSTKITNAEISGPGDATITASASSPKKGKIKVKLHIKAKNKKHPLYRGYTAEMVGEVKP